MARIRAKYIKTISAPKVLFEAKFVLDIAPISTHVLLFQEKITELQQTVLRYKKQIEDYNALAKTLSDMAITTNLNLTTLREQLSALKIMQYKLTKLGVIK